ncbi:hypothetical protein [Cupriavidus pinatubonensis]|uniref:hypothetical protein n=1 Tax=Cupriavidus pinatubonensis TaxID=248026 RepID=UPI001CC43DAC|nr:hypothetical protein [Cupriavidus pinatubonensis]
MNKWARRRIHEPLPDKAWRDRPANHSTATDDKESAIILIFIDLVIFVYLAAFSGAFCRSFGEPGAD